MNILYRVTLHISYLNQNYQVTFRDLFPAICSKQLSCVIALMQYIRLLGDTNFCNIVVWSIR